MEPAKPKSRVTGRDIARRLNINQATVSRALRDDPRITEAMRRKVQQTARELGYRPDPMLAALAHYRQSRVKSPIGAALAWINHWPDPKGLRSFREFDLYWRGAQDEAERCGFRLDEFIVNNSLTPARLEKILLTRDIRGILIPPHGNFSPEWNDFNWDHFCVVRFGYSIPSPRAHIVTSDQVTDGMVAFENIWKRGYRRIGLVTLAESVTRFGAGYLFSRMKRSPDLRMPPLTITDAITEQNRRQVKTWIGKNKPDAILTDVGKLPGLLAQAGYRVPEDVGLATLSVLDGGVDAGIDQNSREIGKAAVQLLISLINHNESGIPELCREVLVEGCWVDGRTLPPRRT